jgi:hypothetical protein
MRVWLRIPAIAIVSVALAALGAPLAAASPSLIQGDFPGLAASWVSQASINSGQFISQSFLASSDVDLTDLKLGIRASTYPLVPTAPLLVQIYATTVVDYGASGARYVPTGVALSSVTVAAADVPNGGVAGVALEVSLPTPLPLQAGSHYAIVTSSTGTRLGWVVKSADPPGIDQPVLTHGAISNLGAWLAIAPAFYFEAYGVPRASPSESEDAPADVLQQFGGAVAHSCDALANAGLNWGGASAGGWANSWAQWVNDGTGGYVCTRSLYWTPSGQWAVRP